MAVQAALLNHLRQQIVSKADHAQFRIGTTWKKAAINEKKVNPDGTVTIGFYITGNGTVNSCRLRDVANNVLATRTESIAVTPGDNVYYFFSYRVYELTEEET